MYGSPLYALLGWLLPVLIQCTMLMAVACQTAEAISCFIYSDLQLQLFAFAVQLQVSFHKLIAMVLSDALGA